MIAVWLFVVLIASWAVTSAMAFHAGVARGALRVQEELRLSEARERGHRDDANDRRYEIAQLNKEIAGLRKMETDVAAFEEWKSSRTAMTDQKNA